MLTQPYDLSLSVCVRWCAVFVSRLDEERPVISHWLYGKVNRTAAVLPVASVKATTFFVQLTLFLLSAYTALLLKAVISTSHGSRGLWWSNGLWAYPLTLLPVGLSAMVLASAVGLFTMITSLDFLTDTHTIDTLMADIDAQRLARQTQILAFIRNKANTAAKEHRNKRARSVCSAPEGGEKGCVCVLMMCVQCCDLLRASAA